MKKTLAFFALLTLAETTFAGSCPKPNEFAASAFKIIESSNAQQLDTYLRNYTVARFAVNEDCEDMYAFSLKKRNEGVRQYLDKIGYGPKNKDEVNSDRVGSYSYYEYALLYSSLNVIKELVDRGGHSYMDLKYVAKSNSIDVIDWFLAKEKRNPDEIIDTAVEYNTISVIEQLIRRGADSTKVNTLKLAIWRNDPAIIELLIRSGSVVTSGHVIQSAASNSIETFDFVRLSSSDQKIDPITSVGVVQSGNLEMLKHLQSLGYPLNFTFEEVKATLLMAAAEGKSLPMVQFLLEQGLDIKALDINENNVIDYAQTEEMIKYLKTVGAVISVRNIQKAVFSHKAEKLKALIAAGADVKTAADPRGNTFIQWSIENYCKYDLTIYDFTTKEVLDVTSLLLDTGIDINKRNSDGYTALMLATSMKNRELSNAMIKHLVTRGADRFVKVKIGYERFTAADLYKKNNNSSKEIYELLNTK